MSCKCIGPIQVGERILLGLNWSPLLTPMETTITQSLWSVSDETVGIENGSSTDDDNLRTSMWFEAQAVGVTTVTNNVELANSGIELETIEITVGS